MGAQTQASAAADTCVSYVWARGAIGGVLERLERRVRLEALREVLGGIHVEVVVAETANKSQNGMSAAADSRKMRVRRCT